MFFSSQVLAPKAPQDGKAKVSKWKEQLQDSAASSVRSVCFLFYDGKCQCPFLVKFLTGFGEQLDILEVHLCLVMFNARKRMTVMKASLLKTWKSGARGKR